MQNHRFYISDSNLFNSFKIVFCLRNCLKQIGGSITSIIFIQEIQYGQSELQ